MSEPVFILGSGGHARDIAEIVGALGREPVFVVRDVAERDRWTGAAAIVLEADAVARRDADFAIGIGDNVTRARVAAVHAGLRFPTFVHPDASLARDQCERVGGVQGTMIFAGVRIMAGVDIGRFCTLNLNVTVSHDCEIGDFANLSPGANLAGNIRVGCGAWVGVGAIVNQGTDARKREIGENTIVGSGTVVLRDCAPNAVYVGNPARKIR